MKYPRLWLFAALAVIAGVLMNFLPSALNRAPTYEGTELDGEAFDFELVDQSNTSIRLSDFRGRLVVLTFMDSKCEDTCPITAAHFREVYRQLDQDEAGQIVFLGINVNLEANTAFDMLETTRAWHLDEIPNWHFLTGSREELAPIWSEYGVSAAPSPDGHSIMHTPGTFLIDASGKKRWYISTPFSSENDSTLPLSELLLKHIREILSEDNQ